MHLLDDMELFVEVVKAKGFTKAADYLNMPKSTLSVRINKLEENIGLRLLNRTTRKVEVTEAGQLYFEKAVKIIEEARLVHLQLTDMLEKPKGTLKISLPVDFAQQILTPMLGEFCQRYPDITLEFDVTPRKVDLIAEPFDLAIRTGPLDDSQLVAHRLTVVSGGLYASPSYLQRNGEPKDLADLAHHHALRFHAGYNHEWRLLKGRTEKTVSVNGNLFANNLGMVLHLAVQGLGIAALPHLLAKSAVENGQLLRILPEWETTRVPITALTVTRLLPRKSQVFINFLKEKFGEAGAFE
nr:LysR family transcriptional regulator [uncultured Haemophilus sp.]